MSKKYSLESRLAGMSISAASLGFVSYGIMDMIGKGYYVPASVLGVCAVGNALFSYNQGKRIIEDYKK